MRKIRLLFISSSALAASAAIVLSACGDDHSDFGQADGGNETGSPDGNVKPPDSGDDEDAGGGTDSGTDSGVFDAGLKLETFEFVLAGTLCSSLARCCYGNANIPDGGAVDGGTYNRGRCVDIYNDLGFESSLLGNYTLPLGNVTLDQVKGAECLAKLQALSCSLGYAELNAARTACHAALTGKLPVNQTCLGSIECAPGHFCKPDRDAGLIDSGQGTVYPGSCAPLRGANGPCSTIDTTVPCAGDPACIYDNSANDSNAAEEACSYRASGNTNLRCSSWDPVNDIYRPRDQWTCQPKVAIDAGCNSTVWCADGLCDSTKGFVCKSPVNYFTPVLCNSFVTP